MSERSDKTWVRPCAVFIAIVGVAACTTKGPPQPQPSTVQTAAAASSVPAPSAVPGETKCAASFRLCRSFVEEVTKNNHALGAGPYFIVVRLTPVGQKAFEAFTTKWLGQSVCVAAGSETLVAAKVTAVAPAERISGQRADLASTQRLESVIRELPGEPCGE